MASAAVLAVIQSELGALKDLDGDVYEYLTGSLSDTDSHGCDPENLQEMVAPFLLSSGMYEEEQDAEDKVNKLAAALQAALNIDSNGSGKIRDDPSLSRPVLLEKVVRMKDGEDVSKEDLDYMWGTDKVRKQFNEVRDWDHHVSKKDMRRAEKEQERFLAELQQLTGGVDDDGEDDISMAVLPDYSSGNNEKDIVVAGVTIEVGGQNLLENADLKLSFGRSYGLIGKNGVGKTTLLRHMASYDIEGFPRHHRVLHVRQEIKASERAVLDVVLESDVERAKLIKESNEINARIAARGESDTPNGVDDVAAATADASRLHEIFDRMTQIDAHTAEARAAAILHGLGFSEGQIHGTTASLSGGWRMRVAIAGALFIQPEVLMLDEPTNHLDLEAVIWLQEYLKTYPKTLLLVSHDRAFLNEVCSDTIHMDNKLLNYYKGNYNTFEQVRSEQLKNQRRAYEADRTKREHMQEFINKFRCNAKRASLVQSRIKALDKMEEVDAVEESLPFEFSLPEPGHIGMNVLGIEGVSFGYDAVHGMLFQNVHFGVDMESRIGILGPNGAGKSTLLNLITDKLQPITGIIKRNPNLKIAAFTQHHAEQFDYRLNAVENLLKMWPLVKDQEMRTFLGQFRISGPLALRPLKFLSGGQKSRVAFAALAYAKPHIVIMDEPTNHLDIETVDALIGALKAFKGAVICVSHDQHFMTTVCNELWVVSKGKCGHYKGEFEDYKKDIILTRK